MAGQQGRDMLIKLGDGATPENFISVGGIRARHLKLGASQIDATCANSAGQWRELLPGAGIKTAQIAGSGVFKDMPSDMQIRQVFFDQAAPNWQFIVPDFGEISGAFQITKLDFSGDYRSEAKFSIELESAGEVSFVAI